MPMHRDGLAIWNAIAKAQNLGRRPRTRYGEALERYDVLVMPTTAMTARPIPTERSITEVLAAALGNLHNTSPFDVTGNPALSVPCGMADGRPIGMMLVGRHFDDATVLRAGHAYEQVRGAAWSAEPVGSRRFSREAADTSSEQPVHDLAVHDGQHDR